MQKQPSNQGQASEGEKPTNEAGTSYSQDFLPWLWQSDDKEAVQARKAIESSKHPSISQEAKRQQQKL